MCTCVCVGRSHCLRADVPARAWCARLVCPASSEFTAEGAKEIHLDQILLNGNNIAMVRTRTTPCVSVVPLPAARSLLADCLSSQQLVPGGRKTGSGGDEHK